MKNRLGEMAFATAKLEHPLVANGPRQAPAQHPVPERRLRNAPGIMVCVVCVELVGRTHGGEISHKTKTKYGKRGQGLDVAFELPLSTIREPDGADKSRIPAALAANTSRLVLA